MSRALRLTGLTLFVGIFCQNILQFSGLKGLRERGVRGVTGKGVCGEVWEGVGGG